jgi:ELWxxDGT repeat protein
MPERFRLVLCSLTILTLLAVSPLPVAAENPSSDPRDFVSLDNGIALFLANAWPTFDPELWRSDGTAAGTYRLTDTCPQGCPSPAVRLVAAAEDRLFFLAVTGSANIADQLWVTGGSPENTFHLAGPLIINPRAPTVWLEERGVLLFSAEDELHQGELWRSDGTPEGTYRLSPDGVFPGELTEFRGKLYFFLFDSRNAASLWTSDGTARGTKLVKKLPGFASRMRSIGSSLVFFGPAATLWRSDGTPRGTVPTSTITRSGQLPVWEVAALGGRYYFTTDIPGQGEELWASDGTTAGTRKVTNFAPEAVFFYQFPNGHEALPLPELAAGSRMVFTVDDGVHGIEPWTTDGTPAGTRLLRDVCPGACSSNPLERATVGSRLIFIADDGVRGQAPWVTDGTPAGTRLLRDIVWNPFAPASLFAGRLFFTGGDPRFGLQIWKTNGTPRGTRRVTHFPPEVSRVVRLGTPVEGALLYAAKSDAGVELWRTDGTAQGTWMVLDLFPENAGEAP